MTMTQSIGSLFALLAAVGVAQADAKHRFEVHLVDESGAKVDSAVVQVRDQLPPSIQRDCTEIGQGVYECFTGPTLNPEIIVRSSSGYHPLVSRTIHPPLVADQQILVIVPIRDVYDEAVHQVVFDITTIGRTDNAECWLKLRRLLGYDVERTVKIPSSASTVSVERVPTGEYLVMIVEISDNAGVVYTYFRKVVIRALGQVVRVNLAESATERDKASDTTTPSY